MREEGGKIETLYAAGTVDQVRVRHVPSPVCLAQILVLNVKDADGLWAPLMDNLPRLAGPSARHRVGIEEGEPWAISKHCADGPQKNPSMISRRGHPSLVGPSDPAGW